MTTLLPKTYNRSNDTCHESIIVQPDIVFVCKHPAYFIAFSGGFGLSPKSTWYCWNTHCVSFILDLRSLS